MADLTDNRWVARDDEFAARVEVKDVTGFFSKQVTVEPGTRALFLEQGQFLGEVPPGQHHLQTFMDRFTFWTNKNTTLILAREGDIEFDLQFSGLPSKEMLEVETAIRLSVSIDDVALFFKNILSMKQNLTIDELKQIVMPVIRQSIHDAVGRLSLSDLTSNEARTNLELCIRQGLTSHLVLHGLKFGTVRTLSISHPRYDEQKKRIGEIWLQKQDLESDKQEAKLEAEKLLASIEKTEAINDLEILAQQVESDKKEADVAALIRRIEIRKEWRDAIQAKKFDDINSDEELRRFLQERDKQQLIDQHEYDTLAQTLKDQTEDQETKRQHLLRRLDLEQEHELQTLRINFDYAQRTKTLQHEHSLAALLDEESNRKWTEELKREESQAEHLRAEQLKQLEHSLKQAKEKSSTQRDEEVKDILHKQEVNRIQGEMELSNSERNSRIAIIEWEATQAIETQKLELQRRKNEVENEQNQKTWENQQERLMAVQKMNMIFLQEQQNLKEREIRLNAEIESEQEKRLADQEHERLRIMGTMSTEALVATSNTANAAILADMKKHESTEQSNTKTAEAQAMGGAAASAEVKELQEKLSQANQEKADAAIQAYKDALASQQDGFKNFTSTLDGVTKNLAPQPSQPNVVTGSSSIPNDSNQQNDSPQGQKVLVCSGCRTENPLTSRCCSNCGKGL